MKTKVQCRHFFFLLAVTAKKKNKLCLYRSQHEVDDNVDDRFNNYNLSTAIVRKD